MDLPPYFNRDKTDPLIKNLWLFFVFALFSFTANAQNTNCTPNGHVQLYTQQDVNNFALNYPNCTEFTGQLRIQGSTITDLSPLNHITSVGQYIIITGTSLTSLEGLNNITNVARDIMIVNNPLLSDISALSNVNTNFQPWQGYGLQIENNPQLSTCNLPNFCSYLLNPAKLRVINNNAGDCLNNNTVVQICTPPPLVCAPGSVTLYNQAEVNSFATTYPNCNQITGSLQISGDNITDLTPLSNLITITGGLDIHTKNLTSLNGLHNLQKIGKTLYISGTDLLTSLNGLNALTEIKGEILMHGNLTLQDISALSYVDSSLINTAPGGTYGVYISNNPQLATCNIPSLCGYLSNPGKPRTIENNAGDCNSNALLLVDCIPPVLPDCPTGNVNLWSQEDVNAFAANYPNCTAIAGDLELRGYINDLSPLENIQSIAGDLYIDGLNVLTHLNDLSNITSVEGDITIHGNYVLQDISGLSGITTINHDSYGLTITNNPALTICAIPNICTYLANPSNPRIIGINGGPCNEDTTINYYCGPQTCPLSNVILYSQDQIDDFGQNYPSCTEINGNLKVSGLLGNAITDISPLSNIQTVKGTLSVTHTSFTSLDAFESLTYVEKGIEIDSNTALTDISMLSQLDMTVPINWISLKIVNNPVLATCNLPYICSFISNPDASFTISGNAGDCTNSNTLIATCNTNPSSCVVPSNLSVSNITANQAQLNWTNSDNFNNYVIEFGPSGFTVGTGTVISNITTNHHTLSSLTLGTNYDVYVRKNCGYTTSNALTLTFSTEAHCTPFATDATSASEGDYIKNFTTNGAISNISNTDSGYSSNGYGNFSASYAVSHYPGHAVTFQAVDGGNTGTRGLRIWVDWNKNGAFDTAEVVYTSPALLSGTHSGAFQIPANAVSSNYRMRVFLQENTLASDPCNAVAQSAASGELEDYTLTVLQLSPCNLNTVTSTNIISNKATINWTSPGSLFEMEWGPAGFAQGTGTQQNGITTTSHTLQGLTEQTSYDVYVRNICTYNQSSWVKHTFSTRGICPSGDILFNTQEKINDFPTQYPYCTEIPGNVSFSNDVTNLAPLNNIVSISGNLSLTFVPTLTSLNGLTSLTSVGGEIYIYQTKLTNLNGLSSLTTPGHTIWISGNSLLNNISGLKNINLSAGTLTSLIISDNPQLAICNYDFMCSYLAGSGYKNIANNAIGCQNQSVITTACATCDAPTNITHAPVVSGYTVKWTSPGSSFDIEWGTEGFVQGTGTQQNGINTTNFSLSGLSELASYDIYIRRNCTSGQSQWIKHTFTTLNVCPQGSVTLLSQADVDDFGATYPSCTEIEQNLFISGYPTGITDLSPLQHIVSVGGELEINSTNVVNLDALSNLTNVGGRIRIISNSNLVDISGLNNIAPYELAIVSNPSLATCNLENFCTFLSGTGYRYIQGNKTDCFTEQAVLATCQPMVPQNCDGDVVLNSQMAVDAFGINNPGCTHISGNLIVSGIGITNLSPLHNITSVGGNLTIKNTRLYNLTGLGAVNSVGGELILESNSYLQDITALSSLNSVGGFSIYQNPYLSSLTAFQSVTSVNGGVYVGENNMLGSLHGLHNINHVGDYLIITRNQSLTNVDNLSGVTTLGGQLTITENPALTDIDGLSALTSVGDGISITSNNSLENLNGLNQLVNFAGAIDIFENLQLNDISGLENIDTTTTYGIYIVDNPSVSICNLENLCSYFADFSKPRSVAGNATGCENMNAIYAACDIAPPSCPLESIEFLTQEDVNNFAVLYPNCTALPFNLFIYGNDITDLSPLSSLTSINGGLYIVETGLEHLDDLSALTAINGEIMIANNTSLNSISGLQGINPESIVYLDQGLFILNNPQLAVCNLENLCLYLSNYDNPRTISGNAEGCGEAALNATCGVQCPPPGDITFSTQEEVDAFVAMYPNCTEINGNLDITPSWQGEDAINDLSPLSNIQTIQGGLAIYGTFLTHLNGLSNLTAVNGAWFSISENSLLEDVSGLSNVDLNNMNPIDMQYDGLYIGYNPLLSVCNVPNFCSYLSNDPATHPRIIENNAEGCEDNDAVTAACLEPFPCLPPVSISALATLDNATISWASMGTSFDIEWGISDFTQGEGLGSEDNISELNYTITGLSIETSYDVYVRRNCADGESNWVKYTFSTLSVCPSGDLTLSSQEEINAFGIMYPNCTQIQGSLNIGSMESPSGITNLSPLSNIQTVQGGLVLVGTSLTNLNGLSNLTAVNGMMLVIYGNSLLEDISGLSNVALNPTAMQGNGLFIGFNPLLSVCNIPNFCEYLSNPNNPRSISDNAADCVNTDAIVNKCFAGNCQSYTIWNGNSWSNGIPDNTKRVIVRNDLTISSDMTACELLLETGIVNINTGATFTVEGEIQNKQSANNFIVHSNANLIQLQDVENIGAITVNRNSFPLYRQDYTLWSSPVSSQNLRDFSPQTLFNRFYSYDTTAGTSGEYVQELFTGEDTQIKTFADARGYMIRMPNNWPEFVNAGISGTSFAGTFKGIPNNGTINIPISTANTGVNLVGNPYPSSLDIEAFFDENPAIDQTLYFWRMRNGVAGSGYATYTALGLQSSQPEINGLDLNNMIKPGQGFFVRTTGATVLNFNNLMRTGGQGGQFLRNGSSNRHRFWLNLSSNTDVVGQTLIGYANGATQGVDNGLDGMYFNDSQIALTSLIDTAEYAIQARSLPFEISDVVPLGFKTTVAGSYKISLAAFDGLFENNQDIFIKDNQTGLQQSLKVSDYEFTTSEGIFNNRFQIVYQTTLGVKHPDTSTTNIVLYQNNKQLHINSGTLQMQKVELFDVRGRLIYSQNGINNTVTRIDQLNISNQVLIVKILLDDNQEEIRKIVY